jgi:hypothetical protein
VVGVPCSGKDRIIKYLSEGYGLKEVDINRYLNNRSLPSKVIINAPADNYEMVKYAKGMLYESGYYTSMVFVNVDNEVSMIRNSSRANSGKRVINEGVRFTKYTKSLENLSKFKKLFEEVTEVDNTPSDREWGTDSLSNTYKKGTPGQWQSQKYTKKLVKDREAGDVSSSSSMSATSGGIGVGGTTTMSMTPLAETILRLRRSRSVSESPDMGILDTYSPIMGQDKEDIIDPSKSDGVSALSRTTKLVKIKQKINKS